MQNTSSMARVEREVRDVSEHLAALLHGLEPRDIPLPEATGVLDAFIELERRAAAGRLLVTARATESTRWKREGFASPAEWLAAKAGTSAGRARDDLTTSEQLGGLDETAAAVRHGELSPDQARAVTDAASVNPAAEADLLECAGRDSLSGLKDEAARRKAEVEDLAARDRRIRRDRRCRTWTDRDGAWNLSAKGPAAEGVAFLVELERLANLGFHEARRAGQPEGHDAYAFDALMAMAGRSHTQNPVVVPSPGPAESPGPTAPGPTASRPETQGPVSANQPTARENLRHLALLHVDLAALIRGDTIAGERCEIPGVGPVSIDTAREVLGDAILKLVISNGVDVLNVTHLGRGPNMAQQIALLWQQPRCSVAGCNRWARLQVDHRHPWAADRVTELHNLDPLCDHHHNQKTRNNWALVDGSGRRRMVPPTDPRHPGHAQPNAPPGAA